MDFPEADLETYFMCKCFITEVFPEETNNRVIWARQGRKRDKWSDLRGKSQPQAGPLRSCAD